MNKPMTDKELENFVPVLVSCSSWTKTCYVEIIIEPHACLECKLPILPKITCGPNWYNLQISSQWKRAKWPIEGVYIDPREGYVCLPCQALGKATWECYHCHKQRAGKPKMDIGCPSDYVCEECYGTLTAKQWDELKEKLEEEHRYDYK